MEQRGVEILDPVTRRHVEQAAEALKGEFAGDLLRGDDRPLHRRIDRPARRVEDQRLRAGAGAPLRPRASQGTRPVAGLIAKDQPEVLFVCVHNSGRSQMAAGLVKLRSQGRIHVRSAGSDPGDEINPAVIEAMTELGVDMSEEFPKPLTDEVVAAADVVITMGCGDACPIYPGKKYEDWVLDDPADQDLETVRRIRDEIDARVQQLIGELLPSDIEVAAAGAGPRRGGDRDVRARLRRLRRDHGRRQDRCARPRRCRDHLRARDHGDDLRGRARLRRALQPRGHLLVRAHPALPVVGRSSPTGPPSSSARSLRPRVLRGSLGNIAHVGATYPTGSDAPGVPLGSRPLASS